MLTYQDLQEVTSDKDKIQFVKKAIEEHKGSELYRVAFVADRYNRRHNVTIENFQKLLYTASGRAVADTTAANYKLKTNIFRRLVNHQNQFLLGNGAKWQEESTAEKLGKDFDEQLQFAGEKALVQAVSFGFWNFDHLEVFDLLSFKPFFDEENGALRAGIRFWQLDSDHPLRATLYEEDGYTEYIWRNKERKGKKASVNGEILKKKTDYIEKIRGTEADGMEVYDGENYPSFPIVPLWANKMHQSEFVGMREDIDCYDLIKSGFASDIDEAQEIYWVIQNAGGMDDIDIAEFLQRLRQNKVANLGDGQEVEAKTVEVPYQARESMLNRLRSDMIEDFMGLDIKNLASGAVTATQIQAAYEPMNQKADQYEFCVLAFIDGILKLAGIEDNATFTRSMVVNVGETINNVIAGAQYLSDDYVTRKILTLLGDGDQADAILAEMDGENMDRFGMTENNNAE